MRTIALSPDLELRVERVAEFGVEPRVDVRLFRRVESPAAGAAFEARGGFQLSLAEASALAEGLRQEAKEAAATSLWAPG